MSSYRPDYRRTADEARGSTSLRGSTTACGRRGLAKKFAICSFVTVCGGRGTLTVTGPIGRPSSCDQRGNGAPGHSGSPCRDPRSGRSLAHRSAGTVLRSPNTKAAYRDACANKLNLTCRGGGLWPTSGTRESARDVGPDVVPGGIPNPHGLPASTLKPVRLPIPPGHPREPQGFYHHHQAFSSDHERRPGGPAQRSRQHRRRRASRQPRLPLQRDDREPDIYFAAGEMRAVMHRDQICARAHRPLRPVGRPEGASEIPRAAQDADHRPPAARGRHLPSRRKTSAARTSWCRRTARANATVGQVVAIELHRAVAPATIRSRWPA